MEQPSQQPVQEKTAHKSSIKTNWKLFGVVTIVAVILVVGGILLLKLMQPVSMEQQVFSSKEICEFQTGFECDFQMCDYKCPKDFQKGWVPTNRQIAAIPNDLAYCTQDLECVVVPYKDCCASKRAISKKYEQDYLNNPEWQVPSKEQLELCKTIRCTDEAAGLNSAICRNNTCVLSKSEYDTASWQTYRNEEFRFEMEYPLDWRVVDDALIPADYVSRCNEFQQKPYIDNCVVLVIGGVVGETFKFFGSGSGVEHTKSIVEMRIEKLGDNEFHVLDDTFEGIGEKNYFIQKSGENEYIKIYHSQRYDQNRDGNTKVVEQILSTFRFVE